MKKYYRHTCCHIDSGWVMRVVYFDLASVPIRYHAMPHHAVIIYHYMPMMKCVQEAKGYRHPYSPTECLISNTIQLRNNDCEVNGTNLLRRSGRKVFFVLLLRSLCTSPLNGQKESQRKRRIMVAIKMTLAVGIKLEEIMWSKNYRNKEMSFRNSHSFVTFSPTQSQKNVRRFSLALTTNLF